MVSYRFEWCRKEQLRKNKNETIKQELLNSLQKTNDVEEQGLKKTANDVRNTKEAIIIIHRYKKIIKTQNIK